MKIVAAAAASSHRVNRLTLFLSLSLSLSIRISAQRASEGAFPFSLYNARSRDEGTFKRSFSQMTDFHLRGERREDARECTHASSPAICFFLSHSRVYRRRKGVGCCYARVTR